MLFDRSRYNIYSIAQKIYDGCKSSAYFDELFKRNYSSFSKDLYFAFSQVLRTSPESTLNDILPLIIEIQNKDSSMSPAGTLERIKIIKDAATKAQNDFQQWGCQIARYAPEGMTAVEGRYTQNKIISLQDEIDFGELSFKNAAEALKLCSNPNSRPAANGCFSYLSREEKGQSSNKHGLRIALEYLIDCHYENSLNRGSSETVANLMRTARKEGVSQTPLMGYRWGKNLVEEMISSAKNNTITDLAPFTTKPFTHVFLNDTPHLPPGYVLLYQGKPLSYVATKPDGTLYWMHGQVLLEDLWPRLEDLHDQVMNFPLDAKNLESLKAFYDNVIETVWLLGNITPVARGTGKLVEQWFTMAHLKHGLRTPILDLANPQIDVLNITLPLSVYKERFFQFFERESLPEPVRELSINHHQKLTRQKLTEILDTYKKTGLFGSKSLNKLNKLKAGDPSQEISYKEIEKTLKHSPHRLSLLEGTAEENKTDTDRIIISIRNILNTR